MLKLQEEENPPNVAVKGESDKPGGMFASFHKPAWLLLAVSCATFMQGAITDGFVNTSVTSIERRFALSSTHSGIIVSLYFFTGVFVNLGVAYVGGRGHKGRWLSAGMVLYGVGAFTYCLPHFLSGYYHDSQKGYGDDGDGYSSICKLDPSNATELTTSEDQIPDSTAGVNEVSNYLYFFIVAQIAFGLGSAPIYTLGIVYLDENVSVPKSGFYLGILYTSATLGPAVGYIMGGVLLRFYTDFRKADIIMMTPDDPGWVGAWWFGMLLASPVAIGAALFLSIFPKELPGTEEIRRAKVSVAHQRGGEDILSTRSDFGEKPEDFFLAMKLLFRNPTMMFLNLVFCTEGIIIVGFAAFLPKLVETLFGQTSSFSATLVGVTVICGGCSGNFIGGWLVKRYRWDVRSNLYFCICACICSMALMTGILLRCPHESRVSTLDLEDSGSIDCLSGCSCTSVDHTPVCSDDGMYEFFSPCHAGCTHDFKNNTYGDCICFPEETVFLKGRCEAQWCPQLYFFTFGLFLTIMFAFLPFIPALHASLRCVPESQRSLSLGLSNVICKIFGSFPAPILFGAIFDSTCSVWQTDAEGNRNGSCWLYDADKLSWRMLILIELLKMASSLGVMMAVYLYVPVNLQTEEEEGEGEEGAAIPLKTV